MSPHRSWKLAFVSSFWGPWTPLGDFRPHFWGTSPLLSPRNKFLATPLLEAFVVDNVNQDDHDHELAYRWSITFHFALCTQQRFCLRMPTVTRGELTKNGSKGP